MVFGTKYKEIRHTLVIYIVIAVSVLVGLIVLYTSILINAYVPSESMEPIMTTGDRFLGSRIAYLIHDPERFDIILFPLPDEPKRLLVKRIVGMPGETVEIKEGHVYINGNIEPLDDSFIKEEMITEKDIVFHVPEECYFVLGDNRNESDDSRYWNNPYVAKEDIVAKALFKYWKGLRLLM